MWTVPLFDTDLGPAEEEAVCAVLRSGWLTQGERVAAFEAKFAAMIGTRHAVAVANCTAALHLATLAVGVVPGDEVIVPSLSFVAGANVVRAIGAVPVFADVAESGREAPCAGFGLDPADVARRIGPRTRAIQLLHFAGMPHSDTLALADLAERNGLALIEDCAHAPGAWLHDGAGRRLCGSLGRAGCFSFFSNKNMTTGEGGMVTTDDDALAARLRTLRSHGMTALTLDRHLGRATTYDVTEAGFNYRMDELRAALGLVQLGRLAEVNARRLALARHFAAALADTDGLRLALHPDEGTVPHILPVVLDPGVDRDRFMAALKAAGIQTSIHYPPSHRFAAYDQSAGTLPRTEDLAAREVTLPLFPSMTPDQIDAVLDAVPRALATARTGAGAP